jgi:hypothetical protein
MLEHSKLEYLICQVARKIPSREMQNALDLRQTPGVILYSNLVSRGLRYDSKRDMKHEAGPTSLDKLPNCHTP